MMLDMELRQMDQPSFLQMDGQPYPSFLKILCTKPKAQNVIRIIHKLILVKHKFKIEDRRRKIAILLAQSMTETEIAQELNVNQSTISRDIKMLKELSQRFVFDLAKSDLAYYCDYNNTSFTCYQTARSYLISKNLIDLFVLCYQILFLSGAL